MGRRGRRRRGSNLHPNLQLPSPPRVYFAVVALSVAVVSQIGRPHFSSPPQNFLQCLHLTVGVRDGALCISLRPVPTPLNPPPPPSSTLCVLAHTSCCHQRGKDWEVGGRVIGGGNDGVQPTPPPTPQPHLSPTIRLITCDLGSGSSPLTTWQRPPKRPSWHTRPGGIHGNYPFSVTTSSGVITMTPFWG